MRGPRPQVLGVLAVLVAAWAHAGGSGAEKLRLVSLSDAPDPVSFPVAGVVDVTGSFEARPTDAGGGNSANGKTFAMLASVSVSDSTGQVVIELNQEFAVSFPSRLPASQYHPVDCTLSWNGEDAAGVTVADGLYEYTYQGTLVRRDVLGNGKVQEHTVGTSATLQGTVLVDSSSPVLAPVSPAPDSFTNDARITVLGTATDATSGIDGATVQLALDGAPVGTTYDPATGMATHTPPQDLPEKWLTVELAAGDLAGNTASISWQFCEDRTPPAASVVAPAAGSWLNVARPEIAASVVDDLAGVDPTTVVMKVLGEDVEEAYDSVTGRVSYTPATDLPEGQISVSVDAADRAGNAVHLEWAFGVDVTAPDLTVL